MDFENDRRLDDLACEEEKRPMSILGQHIFQTAGMMIREQVKKGEGD